MPGESPFFTVIIPTYNYSNVLRCAVKSVLLQTFTDFELIVVGDGCTDDSEQVVQSFDDPRVQWINLPENTGNQGIPNNTALEMANGTYILHLGHDDLWLPIHLQTVYNDLEKENGEISFGITAAVYIGPPPEVIHHVPRIYRPQEGKINAAASQFLYRRELGIAVGWRNYKDLPRNMYTDEDFQHRFHSKFPAAKGIFPHKLTVLKFASNWKPGTYKRKPSFQQEAYLARIQSETDLSERITFETLAAYVEGNCYPPQIQWENLPDRKGAGYDALRKLKGLDIEDDLDQYVFTLTDMSNLHAQIAHYRKQIHQMEQSRVWKLKIWAGRFWQRLKMMLGRA